MACRYAFKNLSLNPFFRNDYTKSLVPIVTSIDAFTIFGNPSSENYKSIFVFHVTSFPNNGISDN